MGIATVVPLPGCSFNLVHVCTAQLWQQRHVRDCTVSVSSPCGVAAFVAASWPPAAGVPGGGPWSAPPLVTLRRRRPGAVRAVWSSRPGRACLGEAGGDRRAYAPVGPPLLCSLRPFGGMANCACLVFRHHSCIGVPFNLVNFLAGMSHLWLPRLSLFPSSCSGGSGRWASGCATGGVCPCHA